MPTRRVKAVCCVSKVEIQIEIEKGRCTTNNGYRLSIVYVTSVAYFRRRGNDAYALKQEHMY